MILYDEVVMKNTGEIQLIRFAINTKNYNVCQREQWAIYVRCLAYPIFKQSASGRQYVTSELQNILYDSRTAETAIITENVALVNTS